jgi:hypothetical protein
VSGLGKEKREKKKLLTCVSIGKKKMERKSCHGPFVIPSTTKINCSIFFAPVEPLLSFQRKLSLAAFKKQHQPNLLEQKIHYSFVLSFIFLGQKHQAFSFGFR